MANKSEGSVLAIDVGGTKTLLACFGDDSKVQQETRFPTPDTYPEFLQELKQAIGRFEQKQFRAAAVALPGNIDREHGVGLFYGNLPWKDNPVKADVAALLGCPVVVENDAKIGGYSEALLVKDEFKHVLYITIGTGIGIANITNGVIDTSYGDRGGQIVMVEHNGKTDDWESIASGSAIKQRFGKKAAEITDKETWQTIAENIAIGLVEMIKKFGPEVVIIGGGVGVHFEHFGRLLENELQKYPGIQVPVIRQARHPSEAVVYGCYELAKRLA